MLFKMDPKLILISVVLAADSWECSPFAILKQLWTEYSSYEVTYTCIFKVD